MSGVVRFPVGRTVLGGWRLVAHRWRDWIVLAGALQLLVVLVAAPLLAGVGVAAIRSAGAASLTLGTLPSLLTRPWSGTLLLGVAVLAALAVAAQSLVLLVAARLQREDPASRLPSPRTLARGVGARLRGLARPSSLLLAPYLLVIAPLGHVGLASAVTSWIDVPGFIGGELSMSMATAVPYWLAIGAIWYLNLRLLLVLPMLALGEESVPRAIAASWRATGWVPWRMLVVVLLRAGLQSVALLAAVAGLAIGAVAIADAVAPDAAVLVAAIGVGVAQVVVFLVVALVAAGDAQILVGACSAGAEAISRLRRGASAGRRLGARIDGPVPDRSATADAVGPRVRRAVLAGVLVASVAAAGVLAAAWYPTLDRLDEGDSLVIAHRGDTAAAVENTIPALEAAAAAGADLVEFDVQQTRDGDWVVMHDFELTRLTGSPGAVKDMTLAEATALTVRADGFEARVPSMREFVRRAVELGQPLLIEIKPHGGETDDYLERFFAILDEEGAMGLSMFHSLSAEVVAGQKALRPEAFVGEILALNVGGTPDTVGDFIVVEDWSYTTAMRQEAWDRGIGVLVWTINEDGLLRRYLREPVDGIITDTIPAALELRERITDESGLSDRLIDALSRLTTAF